MDGVAATLPEVRPGPAGWRVESPFVVRVAGLPASALTGLRSEPLLADIGTALAAEAWLRREGGALADELFGVIGALDRPELRPRLVGLRRALFRARRPRSAEWGPAVAGALPGRLRARVQRWVARHVELERLVAGLPAAVDREADRTLRRLLAVAADPAFRHGVAQSSPVLSAELDKPRPRPPRPVAARLARYVSRAATKTSPNTTFTSIGAGTWTPSGAFLRIAGPEHVGVPRGVIGDAGRPHGVAEWGAGDVGRPHAGGAGGAAVGPPLRGLLELHGPLFGEVERALGGRAELRPRMLVRANPSATRPGDRLMLLGGPPVEPVVAVPALPEVLECLRMLGDGWCPLGELVDRLAVPGGAPAGRVARFVDRLIEVGVLELRVPVDDQCADRFGALASWLRRVGGDETVARRCTELSDLLGRPTDLAEVPAHRARVRAVRRAAARLRTAAGVPSDLGDAGDVVYEHTVYRHPVAAAGLPAWRGALADLDHIRRWLALHDPSLPMRLTVGRYLGETFGEGCSVPFVRFHRAVLADLATVLQPSTVSNQPDSELEELRRRSVGMVLGRRPDADGVIRVEPAWLAGQPVPAYARPPASVAWYVQPHGARLVLNSALSGHGRGRGRWLHLVAAANGGRLPAELQPSTVFDSADERVVASSGAFGHVLNLRTPLTSHELDYPFTVVRDGRPRIPLRDLVVEHDPATGLARLRSARLGTTITPVHAGMMTELLLPPGLQLLVGGLGAAPTLVRPGGLLAPEPADGEIGFGPRVEAGVITLRRATWSVPHERVPRRAPGEPGAGYLLRLHRWLAEHGIPDRCFVRVTTAAAYTKSRKPLYVDFGSPWLVDTFERMVARPATRVVFTEVLPALPTNGERVTELIVETTASPP